MITAWQVYWITRLDSIQVAVWIGILLSLGVLAIVLFKWLLESEDLNLELGIVFFILLSISIMIGIFVPSTKHAVLIYVIPKISKNEDIQKIPKDLAKFVAKYLEDKLGKGDNHGK